MKRWIRVLLYALYLLILSSLFLPLSHASLAQFAKEFLIRLAVVTVFAALTLRVINIGAAEPYRITEVPQSVTTEDVAPVELQDAPAMPQPQFPPKQRRSLLIFWILVLSIYCVTQTSWWSHQLWVGRLMETVIRWAILLSCSGCMVLFFLPKPDANQPEPLHVVPSESAKIDAPSAPKSAN